MRCRLLLPFDEPEFIRQSILPSQDGDALARALLRAQGAIWPMRRASCPTNSARCPRAATPFERCNLWLLYTALGWGVDKVRFVCLWNGGGGDGPGGTEHMYDEVKRRTGRVSWIDTRELW